MTLTHSDLDWSVAPPPVKRKEQKVENDDSETEPKFVTGVEGDGRDDEEEHEPEVRLISAEWKPGPKGFEYNEKCFLEVKTEYLKNTIRAKVRGKLFAIFNDREEDLAQVVEGFIEDDVATLEIEHLWYANLQHYNTCKENPRTPVKYFVKNISHSRGENVIDKSPVLQMPPERPILRRGHYDCMAVSKYSFRTVDGDGYIAGEDVKKLQQLLLDYGFDEVGPVDGDFGNKTHEAVTLFQDCARKEKRAKGHDLIDVEPTFSKESDGIVDECTWSELDVWKEMEYYRPVAHLTVSLAIDPNDPQAKDDTYLLYETEREDGCYAVQRTVSDDTVEGDGQLTLEFYGLTEGQSYELDIVRGGHSYVLIPPFRWDKRDKKKYNPLTFLVKAAIRENYTYYIQRMGHEGEIRQERIQHLKDRWVYVFAEREEKPGEGWLDGEYYFDHQGKAHQVDLMSQRGNDFRMPGNCADNQIELKLRIHGDNLSCYVGASPFQLTWKRVLEISREPWKRCYKVGTASTMGLTWIPERVQFQNDITSTADPATEGLERNTLVIAVRDLLSQACGANKAFQGALDHYKAVRFDTNVEKDEDGTISFESSEEQTRCQMMQLTAGLVIQALTGGQDNAQWNSSLSNRLRDDGRQFRGWLSNRLHAHRGAYLKVSREANKVFECLCSEGWDGVEEDIAAVYEPEESGTAWGYLLGSIERLDEFEDGNDRLLRHFSGDHPVLSEKGIIATGKELHDISSNYVKVVTAIGKTYVTSHQVDIATKKNFVLRLFREGLGVDIEPITEIISESEYLAEFDKAHKGESILFERYQVDRNTLNKLKRIDKVEFALESMGAVLDGLSVALYLGERFGGGELTTEDHAGAVKSASAFLFYMCKRTSLKYTAAGRVAKKANPYAVVLFSVVDAYFSGQKASQAFQSGNVEATLAHATSTAGHLLSAAGGVMMFFPLTAPVGLGLVVTGMVIGAGGSFWLGSLADNEVTNFLVNSPWGTRGNNSLPISELENNLQEYITYLNRKAE
ncbi:peptidoglycan-binding domain-containing protein [Chitinispirillales bacterium ANBcel5]|uniref:peptidoglycan-binding domain-containing protein n=1 Tax=Cellulosispirillum alkaliphilum TaxID=3039283 RepID=UPI002A522CDA|nr:peptidoglycan-binding domain-containing protein [Chitinispirillales bacterium ANBcel5]